MNEGARCYRISLMHAGKVLASDTPQALIVNRGKQTLEETFIDYLEEATGKNEDPGDIQLDSKSSPQTKQFTSTAFSTLRLFGYAYREWLEILRDPIRLTFALLGSVILMFIMGYGITMDVEDLSFAVLD